MSKLKAGDIVTIRHSKRLEQSGHGLLVNKQGVVTRVLCSNGNLMGAYVDVKAMRRTRNYYIPICSIDGSDYIDKMRNLSILKSTLI